MCGGKGRRTREHRESSGTERKVPYLASVQVTKRTLRIHCTWYFAHHTAQALGQGYLMYQYLGYM